MQASIKELDGVKINVGIPEGELSYIASIQEYGCRIKVTPKMRAWFRGKGVYLKSSTTEIVIPERAFLRGGFDEHAEQVINSYSKILGEVLSGNIDADVFLDNMGGELATKIKRYARDLKTPPNSALTVQWKGSSNPLVTKKSEMIEAIKHEIEKP